MAGSKHAAAALASPLPSIFISYSHRDAQFRERLEVHLAQLKREGIETWFDGDMVAGDELDPTIRRALKKADIFVALASPDYLHSSYCFDREYSFALRKARRKKLHVVVAIVRRCQWKHTRMANYLALPKDGKAVEDFSHRTRAYEQIVEELRRLIKGLRSSTEAPPTRVSQVRRVAKVKRRPGSTGSPASSSGAKSKAQVKRATPSGKQPAAKTAKAAPRRRPPAHRRKGS